MAGYLTYFKLKKAKTPYVNVLPSLSQSIATALRESIEQNGVERAIIVDPEGNILDGHNRQKNEPDCPFEINANLKTDAEKRAFVFNCGALHRQMTTKEQKTFRNKMKPTAAALRKQGLTQEETAARLGVSRSWVKRLESSSGNNGRSTIITTGRPRVLSDSERKDILRRLDAGETQAALAAHFTVSRETISKIKQQAAPKAKPSKNKSAKTISGRAVAGRLDIGSGLKAKEAAKRYGFSSLTALTRAALVVEDGDVALTDAMDQEIITIGTAQRLLANTKEERAKEIEQANVKAIAKRHKIATGKSRDPKSYLLATIETTYVQWHDLQVTGSAIPKKKAEELQHLQKQALLLQHKICEKFTTLFKEIDLCLPKTVVPKTS